MGNIYTKLAQYGRAIEYYQKSLLIAESLGDKRRQSSQLNNIGTNYKRQQIFDTAIAYERRSYRLNSNLDNERERALNLLNIGECKIKLRRFNERHILDLSQTPPRSATLYLMSDGFKDQFNERKKRFMTKRLRLLLVEIATKPLGEQKEALAAATDQFQGNMFQVDDILVVGVKL